MIKSMTGYGRSSCRLNGMTAHVEVRTLNRTTLDLSLKTPTLFREREQELRALASRSLSRGKAELLITVDSLGETFAYVLNRPLMEAYYRQLTAIADELKAPHPPDLLTSILRLPEVLQQKADNLDEALWEVVHRAVNEALDQANDYRSTEGSRLQEELSERIEAIADLLEAIAPIEQGRLESIRQRLLRAMEEFRGSLSADPNRFEQELIFYLEKLDITEEKVRLRQHLHYFEETMKAPVSSGKKLGFIAQEIGREINTIGSKAGDAAMQRLVVQMKDELEKVKEQLMNIL